MENTARRIPNQDKARHALEEFLRLASEQELVGRYLLTLDLERGGVRQTKLEKLQPVMER